MLPDEFRATVLEPAFQKTMEEVKICFETMITGLKQCFGPASGPVEREMRGLLEKTEKALWVIFERFGEKPFKVDVTESVDIVSLESSASEAYIRELTRFRDESLAIILNATGALQASARLDIERSTKH